MSAGRVALLAGGGTVALGVVGLIFMLREPPRRAAVSPADGGAGRVGDDGTPGPRAPGDRPRAVRPPVAPRASWPTDVSADAVKPPAEGFDTWTGEEFYRPGELAEAARQRGVSVEVFAESRRAFWLTQLTLEWSVLEELQGQNTAEVRKRLTELSTKAHEDVEAILDAASRREISDSEARSRMRNFEEAYRKGYCEAAGIPNSDFERFFIPELVPEP